MFETLSTLFRARAAEAEEALIDRNAITLLAQHLRDAKAEIARSRAAIARLMVQDTDRGRGLDQLSTEIAKREGEARAAMKADHAELAEEIAEAIIALEDRRAADAEARATLAARIDDAKQRLAINEARFQDLADQLRAAREASLARTPAPTSQANVTASALDRAVETAATLTARDQRLADLEDAYRRLDGESPVASLDARITAAGLDRSKQTRRDDILKRLKNKGDRK